jgi:uncharacterized DUF497 family protein
MSHGLNLTEADTLIFYAPIYSNDEFQQVTERFNRAGQKNKMTIVRMAAHPLEWEIYRLLANRQSQKVVNPDRQNRERAGFRGGARRRRWKGSERVSHTAEPPVLVRAEDHLDVPVGAADRRGRQRPGVHRLAPEYRRA